MGFSKEDSNTAFFYSDPQINQVSNLDWLWQIFKHRDSSIRIMGYQMASIIGAKYPAFFSSRSLKTKEKYISFAQLVLLSLYIL